jgi:hypothetical protein
MKRNFIVKRKRFIAVIPESLSILNLFAGCGLKTPSEITAVLGKLGLKQRMGCIHQGIQLELDYRAPLVSIR